MNIIDRQEKYPAVSKKLNRNDEQRLMRMKRILIMLITLLLIFCLPALAFAERVPVIIDDADLLSDDEEGELYTAMLPVCSYATPIFWSTAVEHDMTTEELASELFRGIIEEGEGILFLVDLSEYVIIIHSTEQLHQIVTPSEENEILGQSLLKVSEGDFLGGASDSFTMIYELLQLRTAETSPESGS